MMQSRKALGDVGIVEVLAPERANSAQKWSV